MDEIFGEIIGCGFGSDSIMLKLLRSAMNKAHENVESTDGSIELLSARSKFYELAMILVEGCSQLIEEKAEIPESNREKMLADLMESRDMVMGRIKELRIGMFEKDKELMESLANEWKLRQKLELKERELVSLREKFEFERRKSDGFDEGKEEECDIRELKNSVDQQVWSIKQKLEDERISLASGNELLPRSDHQMFELKMQERELFMRPEQKIVIDQMSSDIDGLKGTLDLAFGRMQNAETRPLEDQWGWKVEKDTMLILIEGFMGDLKEKFQVELEKSAKKEVASGWLNENWGILIEDITCLHQELGDLCYSNETESKKVVQSHESLVPARKISRASSEPLSQSSLAEDPRDEDKDGDGSHVAKMIKSHESIIRKQREELNRLKREMILREKEESLSSKRLKDSNNLERRIQEVVARLDNVIKWKGKIQEERGKFSDAETFAEKFGCRRQTSLNDEIRMLKQEGDDSNLEIMMMEETYVVLFKGLLEDFYLNLENYETSSTTRDDIFTFLLKEIAKDWKKKMDFDSSGNTIKEERNQLPICKSFSRKHQEVRNPLNSLEKFVESKLKEDVYTVFIREMIMEFDAFKCENLIKEEIHSFLIIEAAKDPYMFSRESDKSSEVCGEENLIQTLDCLLKCVEVEEDLMLKASCEIKEHNTNNDLVATECEEVDERDAIEWLLIEEESTFCSVSNKLEKALQQLFISKELLRELQVGLGIISVGNMGKVYERENSFGLPKDNQIGELGLSNSVFSPLIGLQKMLVDFESMAQQKLGMNLLRLKELKQQIHPLAQPMASLRKTKLLYKKAFSRRCHNLRLAETEVDLLGDQVDVLVGLLEKIYLIMDQHSPVLSPHFQVYNILKLIKKEIRGVAAQQPL